MSAALDLWDYRRRVHEIYTRARGGEGETAWAQWAGDRDHLFRTHPQSPIEDRGSFRGLAYFDYDPEWRLLGDFQPVDEEERLLDHSGDGSTRFVKVGDVRFAVEDQVATLEVLWLDAYGGGIFIPFRDGTSGDTTYGGGRYLIDTVKGADLGHDAGRIVLDFNYAYHPSCVHSDRWSCPLAPAVNRLPFRVEAGERLTGP